MTFFIYEPFQDNGFLYSFGKFLWRQYFKFFFFFQISLKLFKCHLILFFFLFPKKSRSAVLSKQYIKEIFLVVVVLVVVFLSEWEKKNNIYWIEKNMKLSCFLFPLNWEKYSSSPLWVFIPMSVSFTTFWSTNEWGISSTRTSNSSTPSRLSPQFWHSVPEDGVRSHGSHKTLPTFPLFLMPVTVTKQL